MRSCVLVPVKAFHLAKQRLAPSLDAASRAQLARQLADRVVAASAGLPVVVICDDPAVAAWAEGHGLEVEWTPGLGLNGAVDEAVDRRAGTGVDRVVIAHADLPFAHDLARFASAERDEVLCVPDRHEDGTNVLSIPTGAGFVAQYGAGSFARHTAEARRCGLTVRAVRDAHLAWDLDVPADLDADDDLGVLPAVAGVGR